MKVRTFITLFVILGVTFCLSGVTFGQVGNGAVSATIDSIGKTTGTAVAGSGDNEVGSAATHLLHFKLPAPTSGQEIDTLIILFPLGTVIGASADSSIDTVGTDSFRVNGIATGIITNDTVFNESDAAFRSILFRNVGDSLTYHAGSGKMSRDTLRPFIMLNLDEGLGVSAAATVEIRLHVNITMNDTTILTAPRKYGSGFRDTILVWSGWASTGANVCWQADTIYSYITSTTASSITLVEEWNAATTTDPDTVGMSIGWKTEAYENDTLLAKVLDVYGNTVMDSTIAVELKPYNTALSSAYPAGGQWMRLTERLGGYNNGTLKDTIISFTNFDSTGKTEENSSETTYDGDGVGVAMFLANNVTYTKATYVKPKAFVGSATNTTTANQLIFVNSRPKLLSISPASQATDVEVNSTTSTFTASLSDSFGNVCSGDSVYVTSSEATGTIFNGSNSSAVNTNMASGGGIKNDSQGKSYWRMVVSTLATTDSVIFQALELHMGGKQVGTNVITPPGSNTNLRKALPITIVAGEVADVILYPSATSLSAGDLTDQTATDYYDGTYGDQGRIRAGGAVIFVAKLTDQFGNAKAVTASYSADSIVWTSGSGTVGGGLFSGQGVSSTVGSFTVDVDTILYTTATAIDTDTVTVTVTLPSGETRTATAPFYTKGGVPSSVVWLMGYEDSLRTSTPTDTMRVDSILTVKAYLFDSYGNAADTSATVTFGVGSQSVVHSAVNADDEGFTYGGTHSLSSLPSTVDTTLHNKNTPLHGGGTIGDSVYATTFFNSDSAKGITYIYVKYGTSKLDSIKIMKTPETPKSLVMKIMKGTTTEADVDSLVNSIVSGSERELRVRLYDLHDNLIVPDTATARAAAVAWRNHPGSIFQDNKWRDQSGLDQTYVTIDTMYGRVVLGSDSSDIASIATDDAVVVYDGSYSFLNDDGYLKYTLSTEGGKFDLGRVRANWAANTAIGDTIWFRTTLPDVLSYFNVFVSSPTAFADGDEASYDVNTNYTITFSPKDVGGNPIYALALTKLELTLLDTDAAAVTYDDSIGVPGTGGWKVEWSGNTGSLSMRDSTDGIVWLRTYVDSTITSGDSSFNINVTSTKVLSSAQVKVVANSTGMSADYNNTFDLGLSWDAGTIDTIEVAPVGMTTLYANSTFDLGVAFKDVYKNRMTDSLYTVNIRANNSNVTGIGSQIAVKDSAALKVSIDKIDYPSTIQFFASTVENPLNNHTVQEYGFTDAYTVSSATVGAPSSLTATDVVGDAGGYVELAFTASANHPGMTGTADDNLAIDYYQIYRCATDAIGSATLWGAFVATPVTTETGTTIRTVVGTNGITSAAYYWVAAVKGDLPPELSSSASGTAAAKVHIYDEKEAATVSVNYAIVDAAGRMISAVSNSNRATATSVAQAAVGDFDGSGAVGLDDVLLTLETMGDDNEYDAVFDFNGDSRVGLDDILAVLGNLGTTVGKADIAPKMGEASININTLSDGDVFDMSINLENAGTIKGYGFVVNYNPVDYKFVDATAGVLLSGGYFLTNDSRPGRLVVANISTDAVEEGVGNAANLRFEWISEEISSITIDNISTMNDGNDVFGAESKVIETPIAIPIEFGLKQNYPNPFNPSTTIKIELPKTSDVRLEIYNILGQKVKTLVNETMKAGYRKVRWDGRNDYGVRVSSGMYIYIVRAGDFIARHKMVLLK